MADLGHADRRGRGLALAWRRWQFGLAIFGVALVVVLRSGDFEAGSGARDWPAAQIAREELGAPVWTIARVGASRLASSTTGGDVWLKDLATGRTLRLHDTCGGFALSMAASPDGRTLAVVGGRPEVRIWDAELGIEREPLGVGPGGAWSVAFSPDGAALAVSSWVPGSRRGTVTIRGWPGRRRLAILEGHRDGVTAMAFSPDGSRLATADSAGGLAIWDAATGDLRARRRAHATGITAMAASPDGRLIATASRVDGDVRLWDAIDGTPRGSLSQAPAAATAMAFSPDGTMLAMARGGGVASLWEVESGREAGAVRVPAGRLQAVAFSDDGRIVATGELDGSVRLWDVARIFDGGSHGS